MELSRQILISELVYVLDKTPEEISAWVDKNIGLDKSPAEI